MAHIGCEAGPFVAALEFATGGFVIFGSFDGFLMFFARSGLCLRGKMATVVGKPHLGWFNSRLALLGWAAVKGSCLHVVRPTAYVVALLLPCISLL